MLGRFFTTVAVTGVFVLAACEREPQKVNYRRATKDAQPLKDVDGDGDIDSDDAIATTPPPGTTPGQPSTPPPEPVKPSALNWDGQTFLNDETFEIEPAE